MATYGVVIFTIRSLQKIVQVKNHNELELKINANQKKDEKLTTNFEPSDDLDVINKAYLDTKLTKVEVIYHI